MIRIGTGLSGIENSGIDACSQYFKLLFQDETTSLLSSFYVSSGLERVQTSVDTGPCCV